MSEEEKKTIKDLTELLLEDNLSQSGKRKLVEIINKQQKEIEEMREELQMYVDVQNNDIHNYISKDKIREKLEIERIKALDRFDNKLDVKQRIYKRNLQVALIDKLKRELLEEK